jgi:hypothetical protein
MRNTQHQHQGPMGGLPMGDDLLSAVSSFPSQKAGVVCVVASGYTLHPPVGGGWMEAKPRAGWPMADGRWRMPAACPMAVHCDVASAPQLQLFKRPHFSRLSAPPPPPFLAQRSMYSLDSRPRFGRPARAACTFPLSPIPLSPASYQPPAHVLCLVPCHNPTFPAFLPAACS